MKRGQLKLSFGMIFSIILIVIFIIFAFYAITTFMNISNSATSAKLSDNIQNDITTAWKSAEISQSFQYNVPSGIDYVCFVDFSSPSKGALSNTYTALNYMGDNSINLVLYKTGSIKGIAAFKIDHIDIGATTVTNNPLCFKQSNGKITITLEKNFNASLVTVQ